MGVWIKKREGLWLALVLMMALAVALWPMPKRTFAFGDPGVRLLFIQSLLQSDSFIALDTRYPALEIDPQQLFAPSVWFVRLGERNLPHYPLLFCFASAFFYWLFGALGLYVVPFLSGLGIGLWVYWISRRVAPRWAAPAAFLAVFASPVVVFSVEFWDHTPSTLLMLGALYAWISGVERRRERQLLVAGLCAGLAVAVRTEFYVLVLLLPLAGWWIWRPKWRQIGCYVLGAFLPLALLWLSNTLIYGSPLGAHLLTHVPTSARNLLGWYRSGRRDLLAYFLPGAAGRVDDVLYGLGALLAGLSLWRPRQLVGTGLGRAIAWLATLWLVCIGLWAGGYLLSVTPVPDIGRVFPLVFALLAGTIYMRLAISIPPDIAAKQGMTDQPGLEPGVHGDDGASSRQNRFLALVAAGFALLLLAFSLSPIGDLQWGARYFLPLYPIVMALSAAVWERLFASPAFSSPQSHGCGHCSHKCAQRGYAERWLAHFLW